MTLEDFDWQIDVGKIGLVLFLRLKEADIYGTATPMQWLGKVLLKLESHFMEGRIVEIETQNGIEIIPSNSEFRDFCRNNFPEAFRIFFEKN